MLKRPFIAVICTIVAALVMSVSPQDSDARAGKGGSLGSRGTRSYSKPATPPSQSSPYRQAAPPQAASPYQAPQPAGGGFFRNMAGGVLGGIAGGILGGMLFRSLGIGGMGGGMGGAGGGIGIFEILLIGGIIYLIYRFIKSRREAAVPAGPSSYSTDSYQPASYQAAPQPSVQTADDLEKGIGHIKQFDPSFDEQRFCDQVMDTFFKIQSTWMNRDLSPAGSLLTHEVKRSFQDDIDKLLREKRTNRLENIAVRKVEIVEAWQESGQDYLTTLIYANLLDYTTDDTTGTVVEGSKTEPVKFEEYWTFTRPVGNNQWQLSAIDQK
ncbi:MAG: Tim44 domain-containing protein [Desulfuromonadales bacterium]